MKNKEILKKSLKYLRREKPNLGLKITKSRGVKSPRNRRDSVEEAQNHLESTWAPQEVERRKI
jgi:hypothetical protein